jgi:hypothetical protein
MKSKKPEESGVMRDERERSEREQRELAERNERDAREAQDAEDERARVASERFGRDKSVTAPKKVYLPGAGSEVEEAHAPSELGTSTDPVISAERERVAKEKEEAAGRDPMPVPSEDGNKPAEEGSGDYVEEDEDSEKADESYAKNRVDRRSDN